MATQDFLGRDLQFPIRGEFKPTKGMNTLNQDIQLLLATIPGERVHRPNYGSALYTRIWDNLEDAAQRGAGDIRTALEQFEPRIRLLRVTAIMNRPQGRVEFQILYKAKETNSVENLVFPFSLGNEG